MARLKAPDSDRLVAEGRLRQLVQVLREADPGGTSKERLRAALGGVTMRTVDRALKLIEAQGAVLDRRIVVSPTPQGPRRLMMVVLRKGPSWDEHVSGEARLALAVVLKALQGGMAAVWAEQLAVIETLVEGRLTNADRRLLEALKDKVVTCGPVGTAAPGAQTTLRVLLEALATSNPRKVTLQYHAASRRKDEVLEVVPWCLVHDLFSGGAFLLAWDPAAGHPKHLRLERILKAEPGRSQAMLPSEREQLKRAALYQIGGWAAPAEPFPVEVRVTGPNWAKAFQEQRPALPEATVDPEKDGSVVVRFMATELRGPARWVLQMGPDAEVLSPPEFREHLADRATEVLARYRPGGTPAAAKVAKAPKGGKS